MKVALRIALLLLPALASSASHGAEWDWEKAESEIRRLAPEGLLYVPKRVRAFASRHGCSIPQARRRPHPQTNVILGEFAAPGQADWAILCSRAGSSSILVLWGGNARCPSEFGAAPDRGYLEGSSTMRNGRVVRWIEYLRELRRGDPPTGDHDHQAIYDEQGSKYTNRYFCEGGEWKREPLGLH